jgi:hypothetical protein
LEERRESQEKNEYSPQDKRMSRGGRRRVKIGRRMKKQFLWEQENWAKEGQRGGGQVAR